MNTFDTNPGGTATMAPAPRLSGTKVFFITVLGVVVGMFAFLIVLVLLAMGIGAAGASSGDSGPVVLELDLRQGVLDAPIQPTLFSGEAQSVVGAVRALERAADDKTVKGVFIRGESLGLAPASAEELRLALLKFRDSGKFVVTHAQGLNSTSIIPYQAVAASDEIWMQGSESLAMAGLYSQAEFLGGVMETLDAQPQFVRHGDYKTAVNSYTETGYTEAHRESTTSLLTSIFDLAVDNISEDRDIPRQRLLGLLDTAPHGAQAALDAGLIDRIGYLEEARDYALERAGGDDARFKPLSSYAPKRHYGEPTIALVTGQGPIVPSQAGGGSLFSPAIQMDGEGMAAGLDAALEDEDVKAVVFRVSSPGGSAAASDQILAAARRVQDAGKPVVVSMGQYAASGGYYVAASADHIVAMPQTITGSIGVFGGKIAFEDTFAKVGYNLEAIRVGGEYAGAYNIDEPFTEAQRAGYEREMDAIYDTFVGIVADGRDMSREEVIAVAEGRVWTGAQALERGLVDELGGLDTAIAVARRLAEIDAEDDVDIKVFPRRKTRDELFEELLGGSVEAGQDVEALARLLEAPEMRALLRAREAATGTLNRELQAPLPRVE